MSNNNEKDIADIVVRLQQLQIQQSILLDQLSRINEGNTEAENNNTAPDSNHAAPDTPRDFQIGDRVRILNPGRFQARRGVITNIGESRVTVKAPNGTKIQRAPNNLVLDNN